MTHTANTPNLADMRISYEQAQLTEETVNHDPFEQAKTWLTQASDLGILEPNAMILATVDEDGHPNTRTVLLKKIDQHGFIFFTNYTSQKAQEIEQNPCVSVQFLWLSLERQVKIRGKVERVSQQLSKDYFESRPRGSQIGAIASHQSQIIANKQTLVERFQCIEETYQDRPIEYPEFWGGYRIVPSSFEFWQGGKDRIHDRLCFDKTADNQWKIKRRSP